MNIKSLFARVLLEEVEDMWLLAIPGETIVYHTGFELRETGCFSVDGFEGVGVFWIGVDSAVDAEFGFGEWGEFGEEVFGFGVGHCGDCGCG